MAGQHEDIGAAHHLLQTIARLLQEHRVAGQEPFVHQQDLWLDRRRQREAQPDHHPRGIDPHRQIDEIGQFGEIGDVFLQPRQCGPRQAVIEPAQQDILPPRQFHVHPEIGIKQRVQASLHPQPAEDRLINASQHPQQRRLSRPVRSDQAEPVAAFQVQVDVAQGAHHDTLLLVLRQPAGRGGDDHLLQAAGAAVIQRKQNRDVRPRRSVH